MIPQRWLLAAIALAGQAALASPAPPSRSAQTDDVPRVLGELSAALSSGHVEDLHRLAAPSLPPEDAAVVEREIVPGQTQTAAVRERARIPDRDGVDVLADVFVGRGRVGRIATWRITLRPDAGAPARLVIAAVREQAALDGLIKLALDDTRQYVAHNLVVRATNLTLTMASGWAFVAESQDGITALVLHGDGVLEFAPPDPAEQAQLRVASGRAPLKTNVDEAFIRLNPRELSDLVSGLGATRRTVDAADLARAHALFAQLAPQSFSVDLGDIADQGWSLTPGPRNTVIELKTKGLGWLTYTRAPAEPEDIRLVSRASGHVLSSYVSPERLATRGRIYDEDAGRLYDIVHYDLDVTFDPARCQISGRTSLLVKILGDHVASLGLHLDDALAVTSVSTPGFGRLLAVRVIGQDKVLVSLPGVVPRGNEMVIEVGYNGRLPPPPLDREALLPLGAPPQAQAPEIFRPDPEPLQIYSGRVAWYPRAFVSDYGTATMRLTVPAEFEVAASGRLVRSSVGSADDPAKPGGTRATRTVEYTAAKPVRYLGCVIGRLLPAGQGRADVPGAVVNLDVVATPRELGNGRQLAPRVADIVQFYAKLMGDAPYSSLTVALADDNVPGGHSPPYLAIWRQPLSTTPFEWRSDVVAFSDYPYFLLAHEIAHQWFGQAVGWRNYHEQWLSEGLAQYLAVQYIGSSLGAEAQHKVLDLMSQSALAASPKGPISLGYRLGQFESDGRTFRTIVYNKSAVVLDMLRRLIGDRAFFAGLRRFYQDHRFQKAGTDDLRAAFEAETPLRLQRFFDGWITTPDIPRLTVSAKLDRGGDAAVIHVEQTGVTFDLPLTLAVEYADGHTEEIVVAVTERVVDRRIPLKPGARKVSVRDDATLAIVSRS